MSSNVSRHPAAGSMIDGVKRRTGAGLRANVAGVLSRSASGVTSSPNAVNDDDEAYIKLINKKNNKRKRSLASNKIHRTAKKKINIVRNDSSQSAPAKAITTTNLFKTNNSKV